MLDIQYIHSIKSICNKMIFNYLNIKIIINSLLKLINKYINYQKLKWEKLINLENI